MKAVKGHTPYKGDWSIEMKQEGGISVFSLSSQRERPFERERQKRTDGERRRERGVRESWRERGSPEIEQRDRMRKGEREGGRVGERESERWREIFVCLLIRLMKCGSKL